MVVSLPMVWRGRGRVEGEPHGPIAVSALRGGTADAVVAERRRHGHGGLPSSDGGATGSRADRNPPRGSCVSEAAVPAGFLRHTNGLPTGPPLASSPERPSSEGGHDG